MTNHAIDRLEERYGLTASGAELNRMARKIRNGNSLLVGKNKNGTETHMIVWEGKELRIVWAPDSQRIVTALPRYNRKPRYRNP